jgi:hypothetical protein
MIKKIPHEGGWFERLTLGLDFNISRRIPAEARSLSEWPGSPGFTIPLCKYSTASGLKLQALSGVLNVLCLPT